MKRILVLVACYGFFIATMATSSWAECIYEGVYYPTGTKLGDLTCQPDGTWR